MTARYVVAAGLIGAALVIGAVFVTGNTFGQRCISAGYPAKSPAFHGCVARLADGGRVHE